MANGSSGRPQIGNFSSTIFGHGSSSPTDVSFWNLIGGRTVLHSLPRNGAISLSRRGHASSVGKRCFQRIQSSVRDSNKQVGAIDLNRPPRPCNRRGRPTNRLSQLPVRAIPAEHLLNVCDVFGKQIVEENSLLPIHRALVWHNISVFAAHRAQWFAPKKRKDRGKRFCWVRLEDFELNYLHLLARKEFEDTRELPSIESPIDISKTPRFSRRCATDARLLFSNGIEKIQRLAAFEPLHVPMRKGAFDGIS